MRSPAARRGRRKWEIENTQNKQRERNLKWGTFTKYRIEQGYRLKWKEQKRVWGPSPPFPTIFFPFWLFKGGERIMMYKREGKTIKPEEKVEGDLVASIIIVLLDWRLRFRSILRLYRPSIGNIFAFAW